MNCMNNYRSQLSTRPVLINTLIAMSAIVIASSWYTDEGVVELDSNFVIETIYASPPIKGSLDDFMRDLSLMESSGVYDTISSNGMLGKYQFSRTTLRHLGYHGDIQRFLSNERVQDRMFIELLNNNYSILESTIYSFDETWHNGTFVTKSGILAGAHLMGPGGVLSYFYPDKYDFSMADSNGTSVHRYLTEFSNYDLEDAV